MTELDQHWGGVPNPALPVTENGIRNREAKMIAQARQAAKAAYDQQYGPKPGPDPAVVERAALDDARRAVLIAHPEMASDAVTRAATRILSVAKQADADAMLAALQKSVDAAAEAKRREGDARDRRIADSAEADAAARVEAAAEYSRKLEASVRGRYALDARWAMRVNEIGLAADDE